MFLEMHPVVSIRFVSIISDLSREFFHQQTTDVFSVDHPSCQRYPLMAALINFVLCLGGHYSESYNERLAKVLYENGREYFLKSSSDSSYLCSSVRVMVVFIWVCISMGSTYLNNGREQSNFILGVKVMVHTHLQLSLGLLMFRSGCAYRSRNRSCDQRLSAVRSVGNQSRTF